MEITKIIGENMGFTGTGILLITLITFFGKSVGMILTSFDNIQFLDAPFSLLDVFIAIMLWELMSWYIIRLITSKEYEYNKQSAYMTAEGRDEERLSSMDVTEELQDDE
jgi:uncharacterized membrane-anchored protein YitT (DUF2179 family)